MVQNTTKKKCAKQIDVRYHFFRDVLDRKLITIKCSCTENMVADIITKALERVKHEKFIALSGLGNADGLPLQ